MSERRMWPTPNVPNGGRKPKGGVMTATGMTLDGKKRQVGLENAVTMTFVETVSTQLTLWSEAFPVSPTPWLVDVAALKTSATSGPSSPDSFASLNPDGSWLKTSQGYCQLNLDGSSERFSETWPRAGMTRNGTAYQLPPSAPLTGEIASGWLPTPSAESYGTNQGGAAGRVGPIRPSLETMARQNLWPTPCAEDAKNVPYQKGDNGTRYPMLLGAVSPERMWPRPRAESDGGHRGSLDTLPSAISFQHPNAGVLSPMWVEWLMGYPLGWTACAVSATASSRRSRNGSHGVSSPPRPRDG